MIRKKQLIKSENKMIIFQVKGKIIFQAGCILILSPSSTDIFYFSPQFYMR
jgi:hypothetical protein